MLKNVDNMDSKSRLVTEICAASKGCTHRSGSGEAGFIDWYLILRVDEDADIDVIKKQYLKHALQLHPDKNNHPKAEIAFKLISQAYTCLSDASNRRAFDLDRRKNTCLICNNIVTKSNHSQQGKSKSSKFWKSWKEIKERFKAEANVIENCLNSNNNVPKNDYPIFKPSDGYIYRDHFRSQRSSKESPVFKPSDESKKFQRYPASVERMRSSKAWYSGNGWSEVGRGMQESPVFEVKCDMNRLHRSKSAACVHPLSKAA